MGQYYTPTIISLDGTVITANAHEFDNGLKLMEHSWIGNDFVNAMSSLLYKNRKKVAWIGDYSNDFDEEDAYCKKLPYEKFMEYYNIAWDERDRHIVPASKFSKSDLELINEHTSNLYLINHSLKEYLDYGHYIEACSNDDDSYGGCVNPLPLLTACGNGRGGGDFRSKTTGRADVGIWAFDELEISETVPEGYNKAFYYFMEG